MRPGLRQEGRASLRAFVDTSAWYALFDAGAEGHGEVRECLDALAGDHDLVTTNYVVAETLNLLVARRASSAALREVARRLADAEFVHTFRVTEAVDRAARERLPRVAARRVSFTDCTSFAAMRTLGIAKAVALDDDFRIEGFEVVP